MNIFLLNVKCSVFLTFNALLASFKRQKKRPVLRVIITRIASRNDDSKKHACFLGGVQRRTELSTAVLLLKRNLIQNGVQFCCVSLVRSSNHVKATHMQRVLFVSFSLLFERRSQKRIKKANILLFIWRIMCPFVSSSSKKKRRKFYQKIGGASQAAAPNRNRKPPICLKINI